MKVFTGMEQCCKNDLEKESGKGENNGNVRVKRREKGPNEESAQNFTKALLDIKLFYREVGFQRY